MNDLAWQIVINIGPLVAFLVLWVVISRVTASRQGGAVVAVQENTRQMMRLDANVERLIETLGRHAGTEGGRDA